MKRKILYIGNISSVDTSLKDRVGIATHQPKQGSKNLLILIGFNSIKKLYYIIIMP